MQMRVTVEAFNAACSWLAQQAFARKTSNNISQPPGSPFTCLQDDSNGNLLRINTATGDYLFTSCQGFTAGGTGLLTRRGSTITLQHNAVDRRVLAKIDTSVNKATASIQVFSQGTAQTITDRNITNNSCSCQ